MKKYNQFVLEQLLKESPDTLIGYEKEYSYERYDGLPFGYLTGMNNKIFKALNTSNFILAIQPGTTHSEMLNKKSTDYMLSKKVDIETINKYRGLREAYAIYYRDSIDSNSKSYNEILNGVSPYFIGNYTLKYHGRIWYDEELISLWNYPTNLKSFNNLINDLLIELQNLKFKSINKKDLMIEVIAKKSGDEFSPIFNYEGNNILKKYYNAVIPISDYKKFLDNDRIHHLIWKKATLLR